MAHLEADRQYLPDTVEIIRVAERMDEVPEGSLTLEEALEAHWGHGVHDSEAGATDTVNHVFRVGRHVLETDEQGFKTVHSYGTEAKAEELVEFVRGRESAYWGDDEG